MAQTYSQSITGINAGARYNAPATITVGDTDSAGDNQVNWAPNVQQNLRDNDYVLCKGPDGAQKWYRYDAERTIPGVSLVLMPV